MCVIRCVNSVLYSLHMAARKTSKSAKVVQERVTPLEVVLVLAFTTLIVGFVAMMMAV